jgi:plastocyanin
MKTNDPITDLRRQEMNRAATEDAQNMPASIHRQERESRAGGKMLRLWLFGICAFAIIIVGAFLVRSRGSSGTGNGSAPANTVAPSVVSAVTQVSMRNLQFYPVTIKVKNGDVVEWKNDDLVPHTATAASFDSGTIVSGQSWRRTFTYAGNFPYVCTFHPQMKGVVIVE